MLKSEDMFQFSTWNDSFFPYTSNPAYSAILNNTLQCPDKPTCFIWAVVYHNMSVVIKGLDVETYLAMDNWTDENNRPLLCELEEGVVRKFDFAMSVRKGISFLVFIVDV
jgi:hypothetical protein